MSKLFKIALGITKGHSAAGMSYEDGADNTAAARAQRLIDCGYVHLGDKNGWTTGAVATLFLERKGGQGDCEPPYDYWEEYEATFSYQGEGHVEFVNAAVAGVYK